MRVPTSLRRVRHAAAAMAATAVVALAAAPASAQTPASPGSAPTDAASTAAPSPLAVPLLSARRIPDVLRSRIGSRALTTRLDEVAAEAPDTSCLVVTDGGRVVYDHRGAVPVEPASTNKLLTAFSLIHNADPADPVATVARSAAAPRDGVVTGDLYLVGGGDGLLTTAGYRQTFFYSDQPVTSFAELADRIKAAGVTRITGAVVGDDSRYDRQRYLPAWPERYQAQDTVGPLSALSVNDGVTGYARNPDGVAPIRRAGDPPALAAETLTTLLRERGVTVAGEPTVGTAPADSAEIARIESTLGQQMVEMLGWSDNTTAELLGKELGLRVKGEATTTAGLAVTNETLTRMGIPTEGLDLRDSSGLDEHNRLTCRTLNAVLDHEGHDSAIAEGLPVAAHTGTLQRRFRSTVADGRLFAKTGSLEQPPVSGLAGFMRTDSQGVVTFSFVQNGIGTTAVLHEDLAEALAAYPEAPPLDDLAPRSAS